MGTEATFKLLRDLSLKVKRAIQQRDYSPSSVEKKCREIGLKPESSGFLC